MKIIISLTLIILIYGCAAPITLYSITPSDSKPGKIHFSSPAGVSTSIALFKNSSNCTGIQRVSFFENGVNRTVYLPYQEHLTFAVAIMYGGYPVLTSAASTYSVPFQTGELSVSLYYDSDKLYTLIERLDENSNWVPVTDAIKRQPKTPFLESGLWCRDLLSVPEKSN